jgi:hypothetical protein
MVRILASAVLFAASFATAPTIDVWTITGDVQGYPVNETCTFTTTDTALTGPCITQGKTYTATGTITGKKIIFKHGGEYNGQDLTLTFTATLDDTGKLQGTIDVDPLGVDGTFTATKAAPQPATAP